MEQFLPENEYKEVEGRAYLNPQLSVDEANTFIDNLRAVQAQQNQQIASDTQALGTDVPSNLGGLIGGGNGYFTSRYQTPQTNLAINSLRAAAQSAALNKVLENEQDMWKKRYQDAYRRYQRNSRGSGGGSPSTTSPTTETPKGDITTDNTTVEIGDITTEYFAQSRYNKLFMKYRQAGYPIEEAKAKAKEDFGKSISVDAPVEPYKGGN